VAFSALHQQNVNPIYGMEAKQIRETNQRRGYRISGAAVRRVCVSIESALASKYVQKGASGENVVLIAILNSVLYEPRFTLTLPAIAFNSHAVFESLANLKERS